MSDEFDMGEDNDSLGLGIDLLMATKDHADAKPKQQHQQPHIINIGADDDDDDDDENDGDGGEDDDEDDDQDDASGSIPASFKSFNKKATKPRELSAEEISNLKQELLFQLNRLEKKGIRLSKRFSMSSSYDEIKAELERIKRDRELSASLRFQKMVLSTCVTGIEFLNTRYDPFDVKLEGWSESINDNIDDYEEIFEELHDKYKGKSRMAPELKLMFMLGGSAVQFHLTNTMFKSNLPGFDQVMKQNPDLMRQFSAAAMSAATASSSPAAPKPSFFGGLGNLFGGMGQGVSFGGASPQTPQTQQPQQQQAPKMKGPSNANDLFRDFNNKDDVVSTMSDNDAASIGGGSVSNKKKKKSTEASRRTLDLGGGSI